MMPKHKTDDDYGCDRCWPHDAAAAWKARQGLPTVAELIDESHYEVKLLSCPYCRQRFLSVFTEMIDWALGEDPMYWTVVPVEADEVAALTDLKDAPREADLEAMARARRSLLRDFPEGASKPTVRWGVGLRVGPHD